MKEIIISLLLFIPAFVGFGAVFIPKENYGNKGIFGMFVVSILGLLLHFLIPLSWFISNIILCIGIILFILLEGNKIVAIARKHSWLIILFIGFILYVWYYANYASLPYDSGLYHLQTINWIRSFALSPGLANLHGRFGFNSIWLILASITSVYSLNAILFFFIHLSFFQNIFSSKNTKSQMLSLVALVIIQIFQPSIAYFYAWFTVFSSPGNDYPVTLLILYVISQLLDILIKKEYQKLNLLLILSFFIVLIKLSGMPIFVCIFGIFLYQYKLKKNNLTILILFLIGLFWFLRGFYLSGCFIYPIPQTCVEKVSWAVPIQKVKAEADSIIWWARVPGVPYEKARTTLWYQKWSLSFIKNEFTREVIKYIFISSILICIGFQFEKKQKVSKAFLLPTLISLFGIGYWFVSAPDIRFGAGYFIAIVFILMYFALILFLSNIDIEHIAVARIFRLTLFIYFLIFLYSYRNSVSWMFRYKWNQTLLTPIPNVLILEQKTVQGYNISVPKTGDQCFNVNLPCTPRSLFNRNLTMKLNGNRYFFSIK